MSMERFRDELSRWIQEKVLAGARGTVVGISGGVDSAVVAALCQRAFPKQIWASFCLVIRSPRRTVRPAAGGAHRRAYRNDRPH